MTDASLPARVARLEGLVDKLLPDLAELKKVANVDKALNDWWEQVELAEIGRIDDALKQAFTSGYRSARSAFNRVLMRERADWYDRYVGEVAHASSLAMQLDQIKHTQPAAPAPQPPEPRLVVSGLEIDGLIGRLRETTDMLQAAVEQLHDYGYEPTVAADRAISENDQLIIDLRAAVERQNEPPEPVEIPNAVGADGPFELGSAISAIGDVVDPLNSNHPWDVSDAANRRALEQVRVIVNDALGPSPAPADGLVEALSDIVEMIDNCADVPRNPDSLPMMVLVRARQALTAYEQERERAKEQGRG